MDVPLQEEEEVEPGEEDGDGAALPLPQLRLPREERPDEDGARHVQHPLQQVRQVREVRQALQRETQWSEVRVYIWSSMSPYPHQWSTWG